MHRSLALYASSIALLLGCAPRQQEPAGGESAAPSVAPQSAQAPAASVDSAGWRHLSGAGSLAAWRGYKSDALPRGWSQRDGMLVKTGTGEDIITRDQFGDFELTFDWRLEPGGNAGVFYRATEEYDRIYWSAPEYQLLDEGRHRDGSRLTGAASAYAVYPSPAGVARPGGQWNSARIVVRGSRVEHWLNGQEVVEYELGSPDWESKVKASKFNEYPNYGRARRGHIGIQGDHEGTLEIRDMRIRELRS
jgi:hypothetical protein